MYSFWTVLQIFLGLFSLLGIYEFIRKIVDDYMIKKSGVACKIYIYKCDCDAEYAIRFAESRFLYGDYASFFDGICLGKEVAIDEQALLKLERENRNITRF